LIENTVLYFSLFLPSTTILAIVILSNFSHGAGDVIRTHDLLITKHLEADKHIDVSWLFSSFVAHVLPTIT